jgi:hypothetical protein
LLSMGLSQSHDLGCGFGRLTGVDLGQSNMFSVQYFF